MTKGLFLSRKTKLKLLRKAKATRTEENWNKLKAIQKYL